MWKVQIYLIDWLFVINNNVVLSVVFNIKFDRFALCVCGISLSIIYDQNLEF